MNPHLAEDTDDECDDPIRLFDNNLRAVYFGSKPIGQSSTFRNTESRWRLEAKGSVEFCHPVENSTLGKPDSDQVEEIHSGITSECEITPICVKLVDCGKFPWYFRKYTQQIMNKINSNQHSDSDEDVDVAGILDDSDDCFIIEDLEDATNKMITNDQLCIKTVKSPGSIKPKNKLNRTLENKLKRRKDDEEIQRALSVKHLVHVDLKRNQGLIGLKIVQKVDTNETLDIKADTENVVEKVEVKEQSMMANDKYVSGVDKTLSHIGTQLIPIEEIESNSICQFTITKEEKDFVGKPTVVASPSSQNITVQFDIRKIPEKLLNNLITKKTNDQLSDAKVISQSNKSPLKHPENKIETEYEKELSSKVTLTNKIENSSTKVTSHVKNVKNTNKYKNDQYKIHGISNHSSLVGLLVTDNSKEGIKEIKCKNPKGHKDGTQSINIKLDKKPRKKTKKQKPEIKSPILHCSTVPKKPKYEMPPKYNKSDTNSNSSKDLSKLTKIVDKLTNFKTCDIVQDTNRPKPIIFPRPASKPFDFLSRQAIRREPNVIPNKTKSQSRIINSKSLNVSYKQPKSCDDVKKIDFKNLHHGQIMTLNQNTTLNEQNVLRMTPQNSVTKRTKNTVAVTNPTSKVPIIDNRPTVCNSNVPITTVAVPASGSESVPFIQNSNLPTTHGPNLPIHNAVHNKMNTSNIPHKPVNMVQNRYASAIILKSNNHTNLPFEKYCEPHVQTVALQRPMTFLNVSDSINCRDPPPPYPIFYPPDPSVIHQGCLPGSVNFVPNQFHSLQGHIGQQPSNPMQDFYRECWLPQNMAPPPPPPTPVPPPSTPVPPPNVPLRNSHDVNQSDNCSNRPSASVVQNPQSVNILQANNSSIIGINNYGLVKKINIAAMPVQNHANNIKGTIKVEPVRDPQIMSPVEDTEIVATKNEMLKELDKLSFVDGNSFKEIYPASIINENKKENTLDVAIMSKPGRFGTLKLTMDSKGKLVETPIKGYSPPILPIPTYQKVLHGVNFNPLIKERLKVDTPRPGDSRANSKIETKPMRIRDFVKCCKRKFNSAWSNDEDSKRKEEAKKISLEEYKKRLMRNYSKSDSNKNTSKEKFKNRKNVDYGTETDLGYDSDSTVVL